MTAAAVRVEPEAAAELEAAALRYEQEVPGLGTRFLTEMRTRVGHVLEAPGSFPVFGQARDVRCAHAIGRFPHLVVFMVTDDIVRVLAFMHPHQRPGYWLGRVR